MELWTLLSFTFAVIMGLVGTFYDNKTHDFEVPNKIWVVFGIGGFILAGFRWGWSPLFLGIHFLFGCIMWGGVYLAYWLGKGAIGGADVKAIMALSVILGLWTYIPIMFSIMFLAVFLVSKIASKKKGDIRKINAPYLPFLLLGIIWGFMVYLVTLI